MCSLVMLLISLPTPGYFGDAATCPSLADAISAKKAAAADITGSALLQEVSQYLAF